MRNWTYLFIAGRLEPLGLAFLFFVLFDFARYTPPLRKVEGGIFSCSFLTLFRLFVFRCQLQGATNLFNEMRQLAG